MLHWFLSSQIKSQNPLNGLQHSKPLSLRSPTHVFISPLSLLWFFPIALSSQAGLAVENTCFAVVEWMIYFILPVKRLKNCINNFQIFEMIFS